MGRNFTCSNDWTSLVQDAAQKQLARLRTDPATVSMEREARDAAKAAVLNDLGLTDTYAEYKQVEADVEALEKQLEALKSRKYEIKKEIGATLIKALHAQNEKVGIRTGYIDPHNGAEDTLRLLMEPEMERLMAQSETGRKILRAREIYDTVCEQLYIASPKKKREYAIKLMLELEYPIAEELL